MFTQQSLLFNKTIHMKMCCVMCGAHPHLRVMILKIYGTDDDVRGEQCENFESNFCVFPKLFCEHLKISLQKINKALL